MPLLSERLRAVRYDVVVATFVGVCALCVSAYTAHVQRQQVRAMVWPILEYQSNNEPVISLTLANKGVGPAIIRRVKVKIDGQPVSDWYGALQKLLGPGKHYYSSSTMNSRVLSPGETISILVPYGSDSRPLTPASSDPLGPQADKARNRVAVEICFSSTLGECWMLRTDQNTNSTTTAISSCPEPSVGDFRE